MEESDWRIMKIGLTQDAIADGLTVDSLVLSVDQKKQYRANGKSRNVKETNGASAKLAINVGMHRNEKSDWAVAEILVYDTELTVDQIQKLEEHLAKKYNITLVETPREGFGNIDGHHTDIDYMYI